ncbi:hypothetical protein V1507DRAFT_35716 [Lipomyces tetrasporus]
MIELVAESGKSAMPTITDGQPGELAFGRSSCNGPDERQPLRVSRSVVTLQLRLPSAVDIFGFVSIFSLFYVSFVYCSMFSLSIYLVCLFLVFGRVYIYFAM